MRKILNNPELKGPLILENIVTILIIHGDPIIVYSIYTDLRKFENNHTNQNIEFFVLGFVIVCERLPEWF